jgi:hypothetical protein
VEDDIDNDGRRFSPPIERPIEVFNKPFSRRHYEMIAEDFHTQIIALRNRPSLTIEQKIDAIELMVQFASVMADRFTKTNPRFDRDRFLGACMYGPYKKSYCDRKKFPPKEGFPKEGLKNFLIVTNLPSRDVV